MRAWCQDYRTTIPECVADDCAQRPTHSLAISIEVPNNHLVHAQFISKLLLVHRLRPLECHISHNWVSDDISPSAKFVIQSSSDLREDSDPPDHSPCVQLVKQVIKRSPFHLKMAPPADRPACGCGLKNHWGSGSNGILLLS